MTTDKQRSEMKPYNFAKPIGYLLVKKGKRHTFRPIERRPLGGCSGANGQYFSPKGGTVAAGGVAVLMGTISARKVERWMVRAIFQP